MQRRHSVSARPSALMGNTRSSRAGSVVVKTEHEDVKPIIKRESSVFPTSQRARSISVKPDAAKKLLSSGSHAIRQLLSRRRRSSATPQARSRSQSVAASRSMSVLSTTSSMTSSGLRYDVPPATNQSRASIAPSQANLDSSSSEDEEDDDEVVEVPSPAKAKPEVAQGSSSYNANDYVTFTLRLEAPEVFPWPQTVSFTAPRLQDWTIAGLQNQRQLKRCSRSLQENILNLYQAQ